MATTQISETVKLVAHGKQLALVLDPEILREMGIDENTPISVSTDGTAIYVTTAMKRPSPEELKQALSQVNAQWGKVLKKLAE